MGSVGDSVNRVDGFDKVTGRTKYYEDVIPKDALYIRIKHSDIAHGEVLSIDTSEAKKIPGVVKVLTCFDVPDTTFATAGHPWSMDPSHHDIADRNLLNKHVRYWGDDIAVVIADDEVSAKQGVRALNVEYEQFPVVLDTFKAMKNDAPLIHEGYNNNIVSKSSDIVGDYEKASKEPGLIKVDKWYSVPTVQHCHIENFGCYAYEENGRINLFSSTQIPFIVRRVIAQSLDRPWGDVRVVKTYLGGGFGNRQDVLYEPLCAWCTTQVGGRPVRLDCTREETFICTRVRHAMDFHIVSWLKKNGKIRARKIEVFSNQGGYASHGHSVCEKTLQALREKYPIKDYAAYGYTVYTNRPTAGAMRGYGIPQATFADESHAEDCAAALGMDPIEFRNTNLMPKGYVDDFSKNENYFDSLKATLNKGVEVFNYKQRVKNCKKYSGNIRRGVGFAPFWYNSNVYPVSLEAASCRMLLNLDGTVTLQCGDVEIGQGADTAFSQMAADAIGLKDYKCIRIVSCQDTDITPIGLGAYSSRQTYTESFSITQTAEILRDKILSYAQGILNQTKQNLDVVDSNIVRIKDGRVLMSLEKLAQIAQYDTKCSEQITAEKTSTIRNNAFSFGCSFVEVEVDINLCKVKVVNALNVHDCGVVINPSLAQAQVHGGMSMGIGYGLSEQLLFDEKSGKPLNNNLLDYKISTFMDHPRFDCEFIENPEPTSPFGVKGLGEPPAISPAAAIRNAVFHATGVAINKLPLNPHNLFVEFSNSGLIKDEWNNGEEN